MKDLGKTSRLLLTLVILTDLSVLNAMTLLLHIACSHSLITPFDMSDKSFVLISNLIYLLTLAICPPVVHIRKVRVEAVIDRVFRFMILFTIFLYVGIFYLKNSTPQIDWWLTYIGSIFVCTLISRLISRALLRQLRRMGRNTRNIIFVGSTQNMDDLWQELLADSSYGYRTKGYFDNAPKVEWSEKMTYLGKIEDVLPYLQEHHESTDELYCCLPSSCSETIRNIVHFCEANIIRFYSVPNVRNYLRRQMNMCLVGDVPLLYIHEEPLQRIDNRFIKRSFDIIVSLLFLICIFPWIYLIVAVIMKLTMPGPIFFKQERNGKNGEVFMCYKFRSMKVNADSDQIQATKDDPRKTKFGNFMRHTNIDELPQFINVLLGNMSIVGPRPHMLKHTEEYRALIDTYMLRHLATPGITGWAQVTGFRGETKELWQMEKRVKADVWYIENWSFWLDIRIIYKTVANAFKGEKNAY